MKGRGHYIGGEWVGAKGAALARENPSTGTIDWDGHSATEAEVDSALVAANAAVEEWAGTTLPLRIQKIQAVAEGYRARKSQLAEAICRQTGKPRWEAGTEVDAMIAKAAVSIAAQEQRRSESSRELGEISAVARFRPVGVFGVLGPFNMPGHLPNGHIMPAVLAGNTVVFKPSELTSAVGQIVAEVWGDAGLPPGVFNMVQGGGPTGAALVANERVDGILFTGSHAVGAAIHRQLGGHPEKMLALEMGGNNPLIVWDCTDLQAAAYCIVQSAFITSGQRCSCARRLIVADGDADAIVKALTAMIGLIRVGLYTDDPEAFMGTVISSAAAQRLLAMQAQMIARGGKPIIQMRGDARSPALLWPGLIDMTSTLPDDTEIFGPLLQLFRVGDFEGAIRVANQTRYGLSAGIISDRAELCSTFRSRIRAGVIAVNRPMTGARSDLPFGGVGCSGNHRAGASFAVDYCTDPVAIVAGKAVALPSTPAPGIQLK